jgi:type I restriction enzyme S subunit
VSVDVREISLHDAVKFIVDNRGKTVPTADNGIPLIATNCIKNNGLFPVFEKIRFVSEETYKTWFRSHPEPGDIIFVNKGTPGRVCLVPNPVNFCIAQDMVALRVDESVIYPKYLFAALRSDYIQNVIENMHVGTLIPHFKKSDFERLMIPVPDEVTQKYIGNLYYDLSMAIELNNQINKTLEEMAQAIFKSWFVDFEPFKNGEFEESELGLIPKGWRVGVLGDIIDIFDSKRVPLSNRQRSVMEKKYPYYGAATLMDYVDNYIFDGVYVLLGEDGTVMDEKGYPILQYVWGKFWVNNHAHVLKGKGVFSDEYLYILLKNTNVASIVTGAVQLKINQNNLTGLKIMIPPEDVVKQYNDVVKDIFACFRSNADEIKILISLRDTLLPKLISGEIRVPVEEVV